MSQQTRKAIFLTNEFPFPPTGGGKMRDLHILKLLLEKIEIEVLSFSGGNGGMPDILGLNGGMPLRHTGIERERAPVWKRLFYPLRPYIINGYSQRMESALRSRAEPGRLLWISRLVMAQYIPIARKLGYKVILDEHNVESSILMNAAFSSLRHWPESFIAAQCAYYEGQFCRAADAVVATSDIDASRLHKLVPKVSVHVIPNSVDCPMYAPTRDKTGNTLFFSGTLNYRPNVEGLRWFVSEILPRLRATLREAMPRIIVAGANPSSETVNFLIQAGIEVHANPPSIIPFLSEAAVVFVPLRSGSGTRLKILEAMAAGRAVVSTGKGAEGLLLTPTFDIYIADQADAFTSAIVRLLRDSILRSEIAKNAVDTVEGRYDWRRARGLIERLLSSIDDAPASGRAGVAGATGMAGMAGME